MKLRKTRKTRDAQAGVNRFEAQREVYSYTVCGPSVAGGDDEPIPGRNKGGR